MFNLHLSVLEKHQVYTGFPLSCAILLRRCLLKLGTSSLCTSIHSGVNYCLVRQSWQCVGLRYVCSTEMAAVMYATLAVEMKNEKKRATFTLFMIKILHFKLHTLERWAYRTNLLSPLVEVTECIKTISKLTIF